jgi:hypothetical protein
MKLLQSSLRRSAELSRPQALIVTGGTKSSFSTRGLGGSAFTLTKLCENKIANLAHSPHYLGALPLQFLLLEF